MSETLGSNFTPTPYDNSAYAAAQPTVTWTTAPALKSETHAAVTITFVSDNNNGEVACVVLGEKTHSEYSDNNLYKPTAEQVYLGVDANNVAGASAKVIDTVAPTGTAP